LEQLTGADGYLRTQNSLGWHPQLRLAALLPNNRKGGGKDENKVTYNSLGWS